MLYSLAGRSNFVALVELSPRRQGAAVIVDITCGKSDCGWSGKWTNSEQVRSQYIVNILISASILFAGGLPTKVLRIFNFIGIATIAANTFFNHQRLYLNKVVTSFWKQQQEDITKSMHEEISVAGDARCDSMGHSAKFCSYSVMDVDTNKVLSVELIQTTGNSTAMELIGLKASMQELLHTRMLRIKAFVTDRHVQVRKYMRENFGEKRQDKNQPYIRHHFDLWHVAKGLRKELNKAAAADESGLIRKWVSPLITHVYWSATSTPDGNPDVMEAKYTSIVNHICNIHKHDNPLFSECAHRRRRRGQKKKDYFKRGKSFFMLKFYCEPKSMCRLM